MGHFILVGILFNFLSFIRKGGLKTSFFLLFSLIILKAIGKLDCWSVLTLTKLLLQFSIMQKSLSFFLLHFWQALEILLNSYYWAFIIIRR